MFELNERLRFPHLIDGDGRCEMLDKNNKCKIYESRPIICNIDKMQEYLGIPKYIFYEMNRKSCNKMILEDNLGEQYLIKQ